MKSTLRKISAAAVAGAVALVLAGCGSSTSSSGTASSGGAASSGDAAGAGGDSNKAITLGIVSGWNDMTDISNLYKYVLEKNGYTVDIKELSEVATIYVAASKGDIDAFSGSPTTIHKQYYDKYQSDLKIIGSYYDGASIYIAVPDYVTDVKSLEDLTAHAAELNSTIVGIEPGSGLVTTTQNDVFPAYGLDGVYNLQTSSTAAMNAALKDAEASKKPIAVTAWSPYWLNSTFDLRKLEDPKGAFGKPYTLDIVTRNGFSDEHPEAANMMSKFKLTEDQFNTLDDAVFNQFTAGQEQQAVAAWLEKNPEVQKELESYLKA